MIKEKKIRKSRKKTNNYTREQFNLMVRPEGNGRWFGTSSGDIQFEINTKRFLSRPEHSFDVHCSKRKTINEISVFSAREHI